MPTMKDLVAKHSGLGQADLEWLQLLTGDWQLLSDLSFADLVLWVPRKDDGGWIAVAHCRPSTGVTVYYDDVVGTVVDAGRRPLLDRAFEQLRICRERGTDYQEDVTVREETVPVLRSGRAIAVLARHTNLSAARTPSRLELTYLQCADELTRMISEASSRRGCAQRSAARCSPGRGRPDPDG